MNAVKYYRATVLVRPNDREGSEGVMTASAHARNEQHLKRILLEQIWANGRLLSRWLKIREEKDDDPTEEG